MSAQTKILIPEVPAEWTERTRSGHTNIWNRGDSSGLPELRLEPPERGLYAERIDGAWYWVSGCSKCTGSGKAWSYITCHEHDRCISCHIHRSELTETPWGHREGFRCKPCQTRIDAELKADALARAREIEHSEDDCRFTDEIICPHCASKQSSEECYSDQDEVDCGVCGGTYSLEINHSISYTTKAKQCPAP